MVVDLEIRSKTSNKSYVYEFLNPLQLLDKNCVWFKIFNGIMEFSSIKPHITIDDLVYNKDDVMIAFDILDKTKYATVSDRNQINRVLSLLDLYGDYISRYVFATKNGINTTFGQEIGVELAIPSRDDPKVKYVPMMKDPSTGKLVKVHQTNPWKSKLLVPTREAVDNLSNKIHNMNETGAKSPILSRIKINNRDYYVARGVLESLGSSLVDYIDTNTPLTVELDEKLLPHNIIMDCIHILHKRRLVAVDGWYPLFICKKYQPYQCRQILAFLSVFSPFWARSFARCNGIKDLNMHTYEIVDTNAAIIDQWIENSFYIYGEEMEEKLINKMLPRIMYNYKIPEATLEQYDLVVFQPGIASDLLNFAFGDTA